MMGPLKTFYNKNSQIFLNVPFRQLKNFLRWIILKIIRMRIQASTKSVWCRKKQCLFCNADKSDMNQRLATLLSCMIRE
jgi:hypothetical protein